VPSRSAFTGGRIGRPFTRTKVRSCQHKGLLTVEIRVGGGSRDRALYDDATRRVNELAKLVAAKLP
jgi:hypothetical protein